MSKRLTMKRRLYREHSRLVQVMFLKHGGRLPRSDQRRLELIRAKLDDIEMREMRPNFERMREMVRSAKRTADSVRYLVRLVEPYMPDDIREGLRTIRQMHPVSADFEVPDET